jgi:hypothetical protein
MNDPIAHCLLPVRHCGIFDPGARPENASDINAGREAMIGQAGIRRQNFADTAVRWPEGKPLTP